MNTLRSENEEMREELEDLRAERDKLKERTRPNMKRDAFWKKIQEYPDESGQTAPQNTISEQPALVRPFHSRATKILTDEH